MNIIAAVDQNWGIGFENKLLVSIPDDMKFFREVTMGKVVVMGRKTFESFPGGGALKGRTNIVMTCNCGFLRDGIQCVHDSKELLEELKKYKSEDIYIIGGESVYRELLPFCDTAYITKINYAYHSDSFFPNLDMEPNWKITAESDEQTYFNLEYFFYKYEKKQ